MYELGFLKFKNIMMYNVAFTRITYLVKINQLHCTSASLL